VLADKPFWERTVTLPDGQQAKLADIYLDPKIKTDIQRLFASDARSTLGKDMDQFTNLFRGLATVYKPSLAFPMTNLQGNFWNAGIGGSNPLRTFPSVIGDIAGKNTGIDALRINKANVPGMSADEVQAAIKEFGISNPMTSTLGEINAGTVEAELMRRLVPAKNRLFPQGWAFDPAGTIGRVAKEYPTVMRNFNSSVEEASKTRFFVDRLKHYDGLPQDQRVWKAYEDTAKYLFNYQELTDVERKLRRIIPFYTFTRKSLPLQVEGLWKRPGFMAAPGKLKENLEASVEEQGGLVPEGYRPPWMQDQMAIQIPPIDDQGKGAQQFYNPYLPIGDLNKIPMFGGTSVPDAIGNWASMISPVLKVPTEVALNKSVFSGRPLWDEQLGPGDMQSAIFPLNMIPQALTPAVPGVATVRNQRGKPEVQAEAWINHLLGNVNPLLSTVGRSFDAMTGKEGTSQRLDPISALTGIRINERDPQQLRADRERSIKTSRTRNTKERKQRDLSQSAFDQWLQELFGGGR
jgi:hypothetical protein